jgi:osmotically-inducible protein OsmY
MAAAVTLCTALAGLSGCVPLIVGGAVVGSGLVVTDRRTTGIQIEDESIELKAASRARALATLGQLSFTSYNRLLLITGQVPGETEKKAVEAAGAQVENVRSVINELTVGDNIGVGTRSGDAVLSAKVKATLVDAKDVQANAYKVVAERGTIFLMGRVTEREATRGAELARAVPGVQKVVRVFEILSEAELGAIGRPGQAASAAAPQ